MLTAVMMLLAVQAGAPALAQPPVPTHGPLLDCGEELVHFSTPTQDERDRIHIGPPSANAPFVAADTPGVELAPGRTRWFTIVRPDTTVEGPWSTELRVFSNPKGVPILFARFEDHNSWRVKAVWLNDQLLFVQVWWGRLLSTDMVINVDSQTPLYMQDNYLLPCEEPVSGK